MTDFLHFIFPGAPVSKEKQIAADILAALKGGEGSGNFGHAGRPGEVGGSADAGGSNIADFDTWGRQKFGNYGWELPSTDKESHRDEYNRWRKWQEEEQNNKNKISLSNDAKIYLYENGDNILGYNELGVRVMRPDQSIEIGDKVRSSYDWDFINDTSSDTLLSGTSTIGVNRLPGENKNNLIREIEKAYKLAGEYGKGPIVLIGGDHSSIGDDPKERIISNPVVLAVLRPR